MTNEKIETFASDGYLICPAMLSETEMDAVRDAVGSVLQTSGLTPDKALQRHIDSRTVYELCKNEHVVETLATLLGPNILLWNSRLFDKPPDAGIVPWHQDMPFWPIDPDICVSAWIAIDKADRENGCLWVIPGSHREKLEHVNSVHGGRFNKMTAPSTFDEDRKVSIELEAGEFLLFDRWLVHSSPANISGRRRLALAARYVPTQVKIDFDAVAQTFPELGAQIMKGDDAFGRNRLIGPPPP